VGRRWQLPLALVAAVLVAEGAVLLLRPQGMISPAEVSASAYFTPEQLQRGRDFRGPQTALWGLRLVIELAVLALVVARPPGFLLRARKPLLMGAAAGLLLTVVTSAAALPVAAVARQRAIDVGLVTRSWPGWAQDTALSWAIAGVIAAVGAALAVWLLRRFGTRWWIPASATVVAFAVAITHAGPVILDPLFNRFEPLPAGQTRDDVLDLAARAEVDVGEVLVMDASRRTTGANAYVAGLGATKRVVLYDTLLGEGEDGRPAFSRDELRLLIAHELAHVRFRDVRNGLIWVAIVAPFGMFAVARLARALHRRGDPHGPAAVPAIALALALVVPAITVVSHRLSRAVEARADAYALELTDAPAASVEFTTRMAVRNVSDPDPPRWRATLLATHPPTVERIGIAEAYRRERQVVLEGPP
jgi:STE24 endopeptidase